MAKESDGFSRREFIGTTIIASRTIALLNKPGLSQSIALDPQINAAANETTSPAISVSLHINDRDHQLNLDPRVTLLDALREELHLTGTKKGCDHGQCGACTVLVDGRRVYSCLTLAVTQVGTKITTIEGLAAGDQLHPMQQAFIDHDAFQCGYCTSGQICSAVGLLKENHAKTDNEVRELMSGNICRCGAYPNIVAAVQEARSKIS
jgi:xanthine dehydrogenase YagT iron-sulfur-binding subunit